jgi:hypothetical protein
VGADRRRGVRLKKGERERDRGRKRVVSSPLGVGWCPGEPEL